ncbi:MAG: L,D-transpeptidase family protein [Candidatus Hydrogenedentes bacterium]|nr:L,D-transpeptidase family protein [Candidatus Hydrogenedentota bacterium]
MGKRTVADVVKQYGPAARERLRSRFDAADCLFPPARIALLAFKDSRRVELYAENDGRWSFIRDYPIVAASGNAGPKLREGDRQVPEGIYAIDGLNPNSAFHLSMKVNYPNEFDRAMAGADGRTDLGGDIFIHGRDASIGCLAMGDAAIEELFTLAAEVGIENSRVVIAPTDLRTQTPERYDAQPVWLPELYANVRAELQRYPPAAPIHLVTDS